MKHVFEIGCLSLGILCLFYYVGIVSYAGLTTSFAWIWILGGAVLIALGGGLRYLEKHPERFLRFVTDVVLALLFLALVIVLIIGSRVFSAMRTNGLYTFSSAASEEGHGKFLPQLVWSDTEENLDYLIVLGAQVRGTKPSRALRKRLERAAAYAEEHPDTILILSGGQGADEDISEAECMYRYLVDAGIAEDRLVKEEDSTSTQENLKDSAAIICEIDEAAAVSEGEIRVSVGVVTSNFHLYRALLYAKKQGFADVSGLSAASDIGMLPHNGLREICAILVNRLFL
ncbi:MAG: YdcF family protein [Lachnospiraceae bacterium]|nr:YdcF family protein [Lachnospiraceae bacterium]